MLSGLHLACLCDCSVKRCPLIFRKSLSMDFQGESCAAFTPTWGPECTGSRPAGAGPSPVPQPRQGLACRPQRLPVLREPASCLWESTGLWAHLPELLQRGGAAEGQRDLGMAGLASQVSVSAPVWHCQTFLLLEMRLASHTGSFFLRAQEELGLSFQITMKTCSEPL